MLTVECAALENALDRLGQIQPAAAQGRIQRHNAVLGTVKLAESGLGRERLVG